MVIVLREGITSEERSEVTRTLTELELGGLAATVSSATGEAICLDDRTVPLALHHQLAQLAGVERVAIAASPYQLASRAVQPEKTLVHVGSAIIGASEPVFIAGPCSVEGEAEIFAAAETAKAAGAHILRGGAFKPRTSPYSFQGLGLEGVRLLAKAGAQAGLPVVTEVMEPGEVKAVAEHADVLQVGSRNMQNFPLLRAVGRSQRPVLLKRGFAATIDEWLLAAEYILLEGNPQVILCERGIRGFDPSTRNVLDLAAVPLLARLTHLPVVVDPSHATGRRDLVPATGLAAIAAGADGLMVEMHPDPEQSISDSEQAIDPQTLHRLIQQSRAIRAALCESATPGEQAPISEPLAKGAC
ncbi:MAG TPA: 3-deoxy-7-phosphoheptulonate synthase [Ktedonobacterales bacterium]|jgi:3-deoxy-7-phosphoheptulonate synthase|nr:3-deoxy-7-phosphoheptulonate synthase [Ktedonobacterales bacterium]